MRATYAGALASLYADPSDQAFTASGIKPPKLRDLVVSMLRALEHGDADTAEAISYEVARLTRSGPINLRDTMMRCTSGLWRLH